MNPSLPLLIGGFVCAAVSAYGLTWLARYVAPRWGFVDFPDGGRKRHQEATPLLGGLAIYFAFGVTLLAFLAAFAESLPGNTQNVNLLIGSGGLFCLLGLWDDKRPLRARNKFFLQVLASLPYAMWGPQVDAIHVVGFHFDLGSLSLLFSVFWLVSCANVVNLVDGLDGLASSVGLIAMGTLSIMALNGQALVVPLVALTFAGSVAGFLIHNWPPARIFLGDAGSFTIGFMVGAVSIEASNKTTAGFMLVFPLALLSVPILDTSMAILRRKLTGRGIGQADRGHIHHRLQDHGLSRVQTLLAIVGICTTMAAACLLAIALKQDLIAVVVCVGVISTIVAGQIFGFHELSLVFRHVEIFHSSFAMALRHLTARRMVVHLEHADIVSLDSIWGTVLSCCERVGGVSLQLQCTNQDLSEEFLSRSWSANSGEESADEKWHFQYSVPRPDGLRATFVIAGNQELGGRGQNLDQLIQVFEACGQNLPSIGELRELNSKVVIFPLVGEDAEEHRGEDKESEAGAAADSRRAA